MIVLLSNKYNCKQMTIIDCERYVNHEINNTRIIGECFVWTVCFTPNTFAGILCSLWLQKGVWKYMYLQLLETQECDCRQKYHPPVMCLVLIKTLAASNASDTVLSSDHVAPTRVHWGHSGLSKTVNESTGRQYSEHCSRIFHIW